MMKRLLSAVICLLLAFSLVSCDFAIHFHTGSGDSEGITPPGEDEIGNSVSLEQIDNSVLKDVSPETMSVPENMKF